MYIKSLAATVCIGVVVFFAGCQAVVQGGLSNQERALLESIVAARPAADRARDVYRKPVKTLAFFGIRPGMTVLEVLPGGGWYSKILAPYLGPQGTLHAVNYADSMWPLFGFFNEEFIARRKVQMQRWPELVTEYGGNGATARGFAFGAIDSSLNDSVDAVLMIRALHNLNRFEARAGTRKAALANLYRVLKPGGVLAVVQHRAPESASPDWAQGQNGYLKQSDVIGMLEAAGFELEASSEINRNPRDLPTESDFVWRLPPSYRGTGDSEVARLAVDAIGESDRMTLRFRKPLTFTPAR
ncbi:MAG: methyltransferase domain-containing protein [Gammaproteobacteria bacterium]|nr:methyltransferase domain-containing protein [Gammaproteobacteria bacterium]NNM11723.1 class I SAM-dependent methyltransferase [Pseudomonadales bacterium]